MTARVVLCVQNLSVPKDPRVWREARTLAAAGFDVTVVSPRDRGQPKCELLEGVKVIRYGPTLAGTGVLGLVLETMIGLTAITWHVVRLHRRRHIDVLHVANPPDVYFPLGWLLRHSGTRLIFDLHDPTPEVLRAKLGEHRVIASVVRWLERRSLRAAHLVVTTNGSFRRLAMSRGSLASDRVIVVRTGPDGVADIVSADNKEPNHIVFAGIMGEQDGVEYLLRALAELRSRGRDVTLELIGDGPDVPRLKGLVDALSLRDAVRWTGWLPRPEMRERLAIGSLAVSPDDSSELNQMASMLKIADYLAQGLAVVASDLPETRITCGDAALYVPPGNVAALADGIQELLDDAALRASLARKARDRATRLVWAPSGERLVAAYRALLGDGPPVEPEQVP